MKPPRTSVARGRNERSPPGSPRPASAGDFATYARTCTALPVHQNPQHPDQDAQLALRTAIPPPATTSAKRPDAPRASLNVITSKLAKVKF